MKIKKGRMTVEDSKNNLIETKDGITCGCGNPHFKMTCHMDGRDYYSYQYDCVCGNSITMRCERDQSDMMYLLR